MSRGHIYSAELQPAESFTDYTQDPPQDYSRGPESDVFCQCCSKTRKAKDAVVAVYYDGHNYYCAEGKGCKDPEVIKAKKDAQLKRRSEGQKRRYAK